MSSARTVAALFLSLSAASVAFAQGRDPRSPDERIALFAQTRKAVQARHLAAAAPVPLATQQVELRAVHNVVRNGLAAFVYYALPPETLVDSFKDFLRTADKTRVDQQLGSTSKAVKTGVATLFGFALESGAVTQTIDQNVATVHANADGLFRFLSNQELFPVCDSKDPECDAGSPLKNLELSASFNISDSNAQGLSGVTTAGSPVNFSTLLTQHQFSSASARYVVDKYNHRDLRSKAYLDKWLDWLTKNKGQMVSAARDLLAATKPLTDSMEAAPAGNGPTPAACAGFTVFYDRWLCESNDVLGAAADAAWPTLLHQRLTVLLDGMRAADPTFDQKLADASRAYLRYMSLRRSLAATVITDPALTVDYTYAEAAVQPRLHTVKVAYAYSFKGEPGVANPGTLTLNFGVDFYHEAQPIGTAPAGTQPNTSRWRDVQAALAFDRPLGPADSAATLSAGVYYQYQMNPNTFTVPAGATTFPGTNIPLPPAGTPLLSQAGSIFAAQALLTIRLVGSGLKVPLGISWANRSELVPGNRVIGHMGFTFDSSPLLLMQALR